MNKNLSRSGKNNSNYKDGRTLYKHFCKVCNKEISWQNSCYGSGLCHNCAAKNIIRTSINYCCRDCGDLISRDVAIYGKGRCKSCASKLNWFNFKYRASVLNGIRPNYKGFRNPNYKGGLPKCIICNKQLSSRNCQYCIKHAYLSRNVKGKNNPMYGKCINFYLIKYKNNKMRSSWEANFAKWLDLSGIKWKYESKTFDLGSTTYTPDFYLPEFDCYIEIKGRMFPKSKKKILNVKKKYKIDLYVFNEKILKNLGII